MGRLDNIVARNKNPKRGDAMSVGVGLALFVLVILGLTIFTDFAQTDEDPPPSTGSGPPPSTVEKRVNNVLLR